MDIDGDNPNFVQFSIGDYSVNQQQPQLQTTVAAPPFGLIVPGFPVRTDFLPVDATKFALTLTCPGDIRVPLQSVTEIVLFSANAGVIPPDQGVLCYWQIATAVGESTGFSLLGAITAQQPSAVFATGWSENEQLIELLSKQQSNNNGVITITIGLSIEPASNISNLGIVDKAHSKLFVAQKIASDLFRFMQSFDTGSAAGSGMMVVPLNIFDRWFQRFENRFRRDPNFFLKQSSD